MPSLGVTVHARAWGGGTDTPVVLVAGLGVSSRYWVRLGRRLGATLNVIAPDLPGFGRTAAVPGSRWPGGPDVREQADQLLAWMDARGVGRAVLVGHSVGCQVVTDVAVRRPDRVAKLVLAAPPFEPGRRSLWVCLPRLAMAAAFEVPSLPPLLGLEYGVTGPARAVQQASRSMDYPMERVLPLVAADTLVVHGAHDTLVTRRWAGTVADLVPRASLVVVDRAGHAMHYSAAAVTAEVVGRFVRGDRDLNVPPDAPRRDPAGPPQPIPAAAYAVLSGAVGAVALVLVRRQPSARRPLAVAAAVGLVGAVAPVPMVTRSAAAAAGGLGVLAAAACRRRWAAAAVGLAQLALAVLAEKPTGPARERAGGR